MLYVLDLGPPMPLVNPPVFAEDGTFLGAPDLLDDEAGLAMEFDGARWTGSRVDGGHRNRDQHRKDNVREELFERAGLIVVRADSGDLTRYRARLRRRLSDARADGLTRYRRRDRWTLRAPPDWLACRPTRRTVRFPALAANISGRTHPSTGGRRPPQELNAVWVRSKPC